MFRRLTSARFAYNFVHHRSSLLCQCQYSVKTKSSFVIPECYNDVSHRRLNHTHIKKNEKHIINRTEHSVQPYGYLELSNVDIDLCIKSANPDQFPDMNGAVISFVSANLMEKQIPVLVQTEKKMTLDMPKSYTPNDNVCILEIPIKYDVDTANILGENSVEIGSLESNSIRVTTGSGNITTKSIKGDFISLLSQSGDINCLSNSQGRIIIQSGSGTVHGRKFQGPNLKITTNSGNLSADSIYSDESHFVSATGNITLKNLHRKSTVKITGPGNLTISGMDGSLDAQLGKGRHEIQISQLQENSSIRIANGSLTLKIPEKCPFGLRINALSIALPASMTSSSNDFEINETAVGGGSLFEYKTDVEDVPVIHIVGNNSTVVVENQDWLASLGLKWQKQEE